MFHVLQLPFLHMLFCRLFDRSTVKLKLGINGKIMALEAEEIDTCKLITWTSKFAQFDIRLSFHP